MAIIIDAVKLIQHVLNIDDTTLNVVNKIIKNLNRPLPVLSDDSIEEFNDLFFHSLLMAYPDLQAKTECEGGLYFTIRNGQFGIVLGTVFYTKYK